MTGRQSSVMLCLLLAFALAAGSVYTVKEWDRVVVIRLGEIITSDGPPGIHFKLPVVDSLRRFDGRVQTLESKEEFLRTKDEQNLVADFFVQWRIRDIDKYYRATDGDKGRSFAQISKAVQGVLHAEFATYTTEEAIAGVNRDRMKAVATGAGQQIKELGVEILDVRLKRVDLPDEMTQTVYEKMQAERKGVAAELRSRSDAETVQARAEAERQRDQILAEAFRQAEQIRAEGDADAGEIYGQAYGKNPEFYGFYRSLSVYQNTLRSKGDVLVLQPDGELFKYFNPPATQH